MMQGKIAKLKRKERAIKLGRRYLEQRVRDDDFARAAEEAEVDELADLCEGIGDLD